MKAADKVILFETAKETFADEGRLSEMADYGQSK